MLYYPSPQEGLTCLEASDAPTFAAAVAFAAAYAAAVYAAAVERGQPDAERRR